jgi:hypothetical protein
MASNLSESYEKVVLVLALLIALALGAFAFMKSGALDDEFVIPTSPQKPAPELPGKDQMDQATASLGSPVKYLSPTVPPEDPNGRKVDTFVGIPWFLDSKGATVDLGEKNGAEVHEGIPNLWWLEHNLDPGYSDSPDRDADDDGFTNREEYDGKTSPILFSEHPALIAKLRVEQVDNDEFLLDFNGNLGTDYKFTMRTRVNGKLVESRMREFIKAGAGDASVFFATLPAQFRFRLKEVVTEAVKNENTGTEQDIDFAIIEDLKPNLKAAGRVYKVPYPGRGETYSDYKVHLYLDAIGEEGNTFVIPENTRFSLPYKADAADKPFLFKEVSDAGDIIIEYKEDGQTKFLTLPNPNPKPQPKPQP